MSKKKLTYEETVEEIADLKTKIQAHNDGATIIDDYEGCIKRLQFLRNSARALKGKRGK